METPRLMDLIQRLRYSDPDVGAQIGDDGTARIVWRHNDVGHPLTLLTTEQDLAAAVTAIGEQCRDELWPQSSVEEAGLNLLLVSEGSYPTAASNATLATWAGSAPGGAALAVRYARVHAPGSVGSASCAAF
jgi:hypothetical protein